jgi:hypothetical protein
MSIIFIFLFYDRSARITKTESIQTERIQRGTAKRKPSIGIITAIAICMSVGETLTVDELTEEINQYLKQNRLNLRLSKKQTISKIDLKNNDQRTALLASLISSKKKLFLELDKIENEDFSTCTTFVKKTKSSKSTQT